MKAYVNRKFIDKYSYVADLEEIKENDYNLNIPRYVDTFEEEEVIPLKDILKEMKDIDSQIEASTKKVGEMMQNLTSENKEQQQELDEFVKWLNSEKFELK